MSALPRRTRSIQLLAVLLFAICSLLLPRAAHAACTSGSTVCEEFASNMGNFQVMGGTWAVQSGSLAITTSATTAVPNANLAVHTKVMSGAFDLTVSATAAATTSVWDDTSVAFGYVDVSNYYFASFNESNDAATNGIFRVVGGVTTELVDFTALTTAGAAHQVRIANASGVVSVYRDAILLGSLATSLPTGRFGLGTRNNLASFDNLQVLQPDTTAPSAPATLSAAGSGAGSVTLTWTAATDNVGIASYQVLRGSTVIATVASTTLTYTDAGLTAGSSLTWSVRALDAAGNTGPSRSVTATVPSPVATTPSASNTGVPAGVTLQVVKGNQTVPGTTLKTAANGDLVITTPGVVIDRIDLYGFITVEAANVTIKRSRIRGSSGGSGDIGLITSRHPSVKNLVLEDLLLVPTYPSVHLDGVIGHDFTARRINTYNVVDGFGVYNTTGPAANVTIESSYIHELSFFYPDTQTTSHTDGTHNDGIQVQGGTNIRIVGNNIQCFVSTTVGTLSSSYRKRQGGQGIIIQQNVSPVSGAWVENNLIDGGQASMKLTNIGTASTSSMNLGTVKNNRFGRDQYDFGNGSKYVIRITDKSAVVVSGLFTNIWNDTKVALAEGRDLGIRYDAL